MYRNLDSSEQMDASIVFTFTTIYRKNFQQAEANIVAATNIYISHRYNRKNSQQRQSKLSLLYL